MPTPEQLAETATKLADSILRSLGFDSSVTAECTEDEIALMITSKDSGYIIGENGSRLDDLQYVLNRLMITQADNPPRIRVDCDHYRERAEAKLIDSARQKAERVLASGRPTTIGPLNAYHRRLVHSALAEISGIRTESEDVDSRFKRITISPES